MPRHAQMLGYRGASRANRLKKAYGNSPAHRPKARLYAAARPNSQRYGEFTCRSLCTAIDYGWARSWAKRLACRSRDIACPAASEPLALRYGTLRLKMSFRLFIYWCALCGGWSALAGWMFGRLLSPEEAGVRQAGIRG